LLRLHCDSGALEPDKKTRRPACADRCRHLILVDESGCTIAMTDVEGNVIIPGALSCTGLGAVTSIKGATDRAVSRAHVEQVLWSPFAAGDIVVMDKLSVHNISSIREAIVAAAASLDLPPYLPRLLAHRKPLGKAENESAKNEGRDTRGSRRCIETCCRKHHRAGPGGGRCM
jgi:hypothetical protein